MSTECSLCDDIAVPQTRERAILIADRERVSVQPPRPTHQRYVKGEPARHEVTMEGEVLPWVSMGEALGWEVVDDVVLRSGNSIAGGERAERSIGEPAVTITSRADNCRWVTQARNSGPGAEREPRGANEPSYTIRANGSGSHPSGVHWVFEWPATTVQGDPRISAPGRHDPSEPGSQQKGAIRVSPEEAATLQAFPPSYPFQGPLTKVYQQIGNAVPPLLAKAILASLLEPVLMPSSETEGLV